MLFKGDDKTFDYFRERIYGRGGDGLRLRYKSSQRGFRKDLLDFPEIGRGNPWAIFSGFNDTKTFLDLYAQPSTNRYQEFYFNQMNGWVWPGGVSRISYSIVPRKDRPFFEKKKKKPKKEGEKTYVLDTLKAERLGKDKNEKFIGDRSIKQKDSGIDGGDFPMHVYRYLYVAHRGFDDSLVKYAGILGRNFRAVSLEIDKKTTELKNLKLEQEIKAKEMLALITDKSFGSNFEYNKKDIYKIGVSSIGDLDLILFTDLNKFLDLKSKGEGETFLISKSKKEIKQAPVKQHDVFRLGFDKFKTISEKKVDVQMDPQSSVDLKLQEVLYLKSIKKDIINCIFDLSSQKSYSNIKEPGVFFNKFIKNSLADILERIMQIRLELKFREQAKSKRRISGTLFFEDEIKNIKSNVQQIDPSNRKSLGERTHELVVGFIRIKNNFINHTHPHQIKLFGKDLKAGKYNHKIYFGRSWKGWPGNGRWFRNVKAEEKKKISKEELKKKLARIDEEDMPVVQLMALEEKYELNYLECKEILEELNFLNQIGRRKDIIWDRGILKLKVLYYIEGNGPVRDEEYVKKILMKMKKIRFDVLRLEILTMEINLSYEEGKEIFEELDLTGQKEWDDWLEARRRINNQQEKEGKEIFEELNLTEKEEWDTGLEGGGIRKKSNQQEKEEISLEEEIEETEEKMKETEEKMEENKEEKMEENKEEKMEENKEEKEEKKEEISLEEKEEKKVIVNPSKKEEEKGSWWPGSVKAEEKKKISKEELKKKLARIDKEEDITPYIMEVEKEYEVTYEEYKEILEEMGFLRKEKWSDGLNAKKIFEKVVLPGLKKQAKKKKLKEELKKEFLRIDEQEDIFLDIIALEAKYELNYLECKEILEELGFIGKQKWDDGLEAKKILYKRAKMRVNPSKKEEEEGSWWPGSVKAEEKEKISLEEEEKKLMIKEIKKKLIEMEESGFFDIAEIKELELKGKTRLNSEDGKEILEELGFIGKEKWDTGLEARKLYEKLVAGGIESDEKKAKMRVNPSKKEEEEGSWWPGSVKAEDDIKIGQKKLMIKEIKKKLIEIEESGFFDVIELRIIEENAELNYEEGKEIFEELGLIGKEKWDTGLEARRLFEKLIVGGKESEEKRDKRRVRVNPSKKEEEEGSWWPGSVKAEEKKKISKEELKKELARIDKEDVTLDDLMALEEKYELNRLECKEALEELGFLDLDKGNSIIGKRGLGSIKEEIKYQVDSEKEEKKMIVNPSKKEKEEGSWWPGSVKAEEGQIQSQDEELISIWLFFILFKIRVLECVNKIKKEPKIIVGETRRLRKINKMLEKNVGKVEGKERLGGVRKKIEHKLTEKKRNEMLETQERILKRLERYNFNNFELEVKSIVEEMQLLLPNFKKMSLENKILFIKKEIVDSDLGTLFKGIRSGEEIFKREMKFASEMWLSCGKGDYFDSIFNRNLVIKPKKIENNLGEEFGLAVKEKTKFSPSYWAAKKAKSKDKNKDSKRGFVKDGIGVYDQSVCKEEEDQGFSRLLTPSRIYRKRMDDFENIIEKRIKDREFLKEDFNRLTENLNLVKEDTFRRFFMNRILKESEVYLDYFNENEIKKFKKNFKSIMGKDEEQLEKFFSDNENKSIELILEAYPSIKKVGYIKGPTFFTLRGFSFKIERFFMRIFSGLKKIFLKKDMIQENSFILLLIFIES